MAHFIREWNSCRLDRWGSVYVLTLTGDGEHCFNPSSLNDLLAALAVVERSPDAGALVTTNQYWCFSNGLDLVWIKSNLNLSKSNSVQDKFEDLLCSMMKLGVPTIAAVCGNAAGDGFVLALAHDYRFMKSGKEVLCMNQLDHGMEVARSVVSLIKSKILPATLKEVMLKGRKLTASEASELRLVDGFYSDSEKTLKAAIAEGEKLASLNWGRKKYANLRARTFPGVVEEFEARRGPYTWPGSSKI